MSNEPTQQKPDRPYAEVLAAAMHEIEALPVKYANLARFLKKLLCSEAT
jgi:hypothetical protein